MMEDSHAQQPEVPGIDGLDSTMQEHGMSSDGMTGDEQRQDSLASPELLANSSLTETINHLNRLMHDRNERELPTANHRTNHLSLGAAGIGGLLTQPKFDQAPEERMALLRVDTSKVFLRIVTLLETIGTAEEFTASLVEQYEKCHRCYQNPCGCNPSQAGFDEEIEDAVVIGPNSTLADWQSHFKRLYGGNNALRSLEWMGLKLNAELAESMTEVTRMIKAENTPEIAEEFRKNAVEELAQVTAWLLGICVHPDARLNNKEVPLEAIMVELYGRGCPNCGETSCQCGEFGLEESRKDETAAKFLERIKDIIA